MSIRRTERCVLFNRSSGKWPMGRARTEVASFWRINLPGLILSASRSRLPAAGRGELVPPGHRGGKLKERIRMRPRPAKVITLSVAATPAGSLISALVSRLNRQPTGLALHFRHLISIPALSAVSRTVSRDLNSSRTSSDQTGRLRMRFMKTLAEAEEQRKGGVLAFRSIFRSRIANFPARVKGQASQG